MATQLDPYVPQDLAKLLEGQPTYRLKQVTQWLAQGVDNPMRMTNLPLALREELVETFPAIPRIVRVSEDDRGLTRKVLLECGTDEQKEGIESVLMLYPKTANRAGRATVCISTQAGCAMGCPFCATGQIGFRRQLSLGEVVRQVTVMQNLLQGNIDPDVWGDQIPSPIPWGVPDHVTNVVFMGMGEPLGNQKATLSAVRWLHEEFGLSARSITVSTVGVVPGIKKLQSLELPITLAISLHAPNDELRDDLVPVNQTHPLSKVMTAAAEYLEATNRRITIEYVMIDGVNSDMEHARELRLLLNKYIRKGMVHVNLIPMNPTPAVPWFAPRQEEQEAFCQILVDSGIPATIRANRGNDIDAACGQLYANYQAASGRTLPIAIGAATRVQKTHLNSIAKRQIGWENADGYSRRTYDSDRNTSRFYSDGFDDYDDDFDNVNDYEDFDDDRAYERGEGNRYRRDT